MHIDNVEVFAVGPWNGHTFDGDDLDDMVAAFEALDLGGKLPVKLGHATRDDAPAQGWIVALRRRGPSTVMAIRSDWKSSRATSATSSRVTASIWAATWSSVMHRP